MTTLSGIITPTNVVTAASTTTLTNKTISGASNTLSNIPLSTAVTGTLPIANGGTGTTSTTFANLATNVTGTLPIANGGTNSTATATAGGVAYGTGTSIAVNSAGTSGYFLQSNGASAPSWVAPSSGAMVLLQSVTASNSATVDLETTFSSTYDQYLIIATGVRVANDGDGIWCRMKIGGTYLTTNTYTFICATSSSSTGTFNSTSGANVEKITVIERIGTTAGRSGNFAMYVNSPASTSLTKNVYFQSSATNDSAALITLNGTGFNSGTSALTGIRLYGSSGNLSSGSFRLYGIANS